MPLCWVRHDLLSKLLQLRFLFLEVLSGFDTAILFSTEDMHKILADELAFVGHFKGSYLVMKQFGKKVVFSQLGILIVVHVKYFTFNFSYPAR